MRFRIFNRLFESSHLDVRKPGFCEKTFFFMILLKVHTWANNNHGEDGPLDESLDLVWVVDFLRVN